MVVWCFDVVVVESEMMAEVEDTVLKLRAGTYSLAISTRQAQWRTTELIARPSLKKRSLRSLISSRTASLRHPSPPSSCSMSVNDM